MSDQALLAILAGIALAFEIQAVQKLAPVIWGPFDAQVGSLCAGADQDGGCNATAWTRGPPPGP